MFHKKLQVHIVEKLRKPQFKMKIDFLKDVFSELCDLFPGQYIHVGGDECAKRWWQESEETQQFMREHELKDEKALQSYFIHYVQSVAEERMIVYEYYFPFHDFTGYGVCASGSPAPAAY